MIKKHNINAICGLTAALTGGLFISNHSHADSVAWEITSAISNRYVTEGIDNVPDGSLVILNEVSASYGLFTAGIAYAQFLDDSYNELNFHVGLTGESGAFGWEAGVTYLTFPAPDEPSSWEMGMALRWEVTPQWVVFAGTYYDFDDIRGGFAELGIESPLAVNEALTITPYTLLGVDYGFVSGPRRLKQNHWQFGITGDYAISDNLTAFATLHHSVRLSNLRAEGEGNVTWASAGLTVTF